MTSLFCTYFQVTDFPTAKHFLQSPQEPHSVLMNAGSQQCESDSSTLLHLQDTPQQLYERADFTRIAQGTPQSTVVHPACDWCIESSPRQHITYTSNFLLSPCPGKVPLLRTYFDNLRWKPAFHAVLLCRSQRQNLVIRQDVRHRRLIANKYYTITLKNVVLL